MSTSTVKEEARRRVERLPDDATWEDIQYEIYVRQAVEAGLKDGGRVGRFRSRRPAVASAPAHDLR
jgi:hypothetical protein